MLKYFRTSSTIPHQWMQLPRVVAAKYRYQMGVSLVGTMKIIGSVISNQMKAEQYVILLITEIFHLVNDSVSD